MSELSILLVGDLRRAEFREIASTLDPLGHLTVVPDVEAAAAALSTPQAATNVIVVAQAFPGQWPQHAIERLRRAAPLARFVGLMGSWCEGELRSGRPWGGGIRLYWHQGDSRCARQLGRILRGEGSSWGLPPTATDEERMLVDAEQPPTPCRGLVAIHARTLPMAEWLAAAFRERGGSTVWLRPSDPVRVTGATVAVFDGSDGRGEELEHLRRLAAAIRPAPTIALLDFPRAEDRQQAMAAGAAAIVSKPLDLDDLFWQTDRLAQR